MWQPSLTNCIDCASIPALLEDIDCKIKELAEDLYNNTIYMLNNVVKSEVFKDLIMYKRILTYKACNSEYASTYTVEMIASRIKLLKYK